MKKILAAVFAMMLLFACAANVLADNGIDGEKEKSISVSYTVRGNYEISIPSQGTSGGGTGKNGIRIKKSGVTIPSEGDTVSSFEVAVDNVLLERNTMLRVSVESENEFNLLLPNGSSVPYTLTGADEDGTVMVLHAGETEASRTLTVTLGSTEGLNYAGTYHDTLTFSCEILTVS